MAALVKPLSRMFAAALALTVTVLLGAPMTARAQALPPYAQPAPVSQDQTIRGRIASIDGAFHITVHDERGYVDSVELHQGTIINPTGLTLAPGMSVTVIGYPSGSSFTANEIDTPYTYSGPAPTPVYYGAGWWYPGFGYGYGPAFSLSLVFGNGGYHYARGPFYGHAWFGYAPFGLAFSYAAGGYAIGVGYYGAPYYRGGSYGYPYYRGGYYGSPYHGGYHGTPYYHGAYNGGAYHGGTYNGGAYRGGGYGGTYHGGAYQGGGYHGGGGYQGGGGYHGGGRGHGGGGHGGGGHGGR
ncbi:MAG TPA: hypothetical protein VMA36_13935 [Candidatus Limnocylindria bacterium]|nr:hypothetical protein [Candidatus Limnocylindria bacterium]